LFAESVCSLKVSTAKIVRRDEDTPDRETVSQAP
jgi:hypothetical protein